MRSTKAEELIHFILLNFDLFYLSLIDSNLNILLFSMQIEGEDRNIEKLIVDHNNESVRAFRKCNLPESFDMKLNTAFGINSNPICNQLQVVGEKYVIFMIGSILVVKDLIEKTEQFYSFANRFNNVTALFGISKEQKYKEKVKQLDKNQKPIYLPNVSPIKIYLAESSENQ